jgi:ABC-type Fe3+ transport system substrate-binding protein
MAQNMGKDFLKDFMKNTKQYADETDTDKQDKMQKGLYAGWTAYSSSYMLMKNSDQGKYGLLMMSLTTQFLTGTNQYVVRM